MGSECTIDKYKVHVTGQKLTSYGPCMVKFTATKTLKVKQKDSYGNVHKKRDTNYVPEVIVKADLPDKDKLCTAEYISEVVRELEIDPSIRRDVELQILGSLVDLMDRETDDNRGIKAKVQVEIDYLKREGLGSRLWGCMSSY